MTGSPAIGRTRPSRAGRLLTAAVVALSLLAGARVVWVAAVPTGDGVRTEQVRFLESALAGGTGSDMQALFPEGYFFTHVLTGLAAAQPAAPGEVEALRVARAADIAGALAADLDGFLEAYPGQVWPCDTVAALARAQALVPQPGIGEQVAGWTARTAAVRDPATGLLPHRLAADGSVLEGPRASSQALVQAFLPDIDPAAAAADYRRFVDAFVVREVGLVGVRDYPVGTEGDADVDSGPLIAGVSLSASAAALGGRTPAG